MKINIDRIKKDIEYVSNISATKNFGCTRFSYSKEDKEAREYLLQEFMKIGATVQVDGVGNIRARISGASKDKPIILVGSHIDTVMNGGAFDGLLGTVCALEILRVMKENELVFERGIEAIIFAEEEGSNFGATMLGSKCITGKYHKDDLISLKNDSGKTAYQVIKNFGFDPDSMKSMLLNLNEIYAMLELHIEQGQILDDSKNEIGIVNGIYGMKNVRVTLNGVGNHAGATPMFCRKDPMVVAGKIICEVENIVNKIHNETLVATVGKIFSIPNASNVISSQVVMYIDIRDINDETIDLTLNKVKKYIKKVANNRNILFEIEVVSSSKPVILSKEINDLFESIAKEKNIKYLNMYSGAVHDCAQLTGISEVGLIFVPSIKGRSHVPEENTTYEDIEIGGNLLLEAVVQLAKRK